MNIRRLLVALCLLGFGPLLAHGAPPDGLQTWEFTVDGAARTALAYFPPDAKADGRPVVFVFHGHGGNANNAAHGFGIHRLWPEAIVICPQGLDTPGQLTDPDGRLPGWQKAVGDQGDRDLHFFDAMLARLKQDGRLDARRVYCTGHSNGGGFTYLLWLARPEALAAVAPSAAAARYVLQLPPKPAMILGGRNDALVKFEWQEKMMDAVRRINGCDPAGTTWENVGTRYPSKGGTPLVTFVHEGGHALDPAEPGLIVKFFQQSPATR